MTTEPADDPPKPNAERDLWPRITHQLSDLGPRPAPPKPLPRGFLLCYGRDVPTVSTDDHRRDAAVDTETS